MLEDTASTQTETTQPVANIADSTLDVRSKILILSNEGYSVAAIARMLGFTKNKVSGLRMRMGLTNPQNNPSKHGTSFIRRHVATPKAPGSADKPKVISSHRKKQDTSAKPNLGSAKTPPKPPAVTISIANQSTADVASDPFERKISAERFLEEIADNKYACSWLLGSGKSRTPQYCNLRVVPGKPYCQEHCDIAYTGQFAGSKISSAKKSLTCR
jgi:GcrA cell cycle regulator